MIASALYLVIFLQLLLVFLPPILDLEKRCFFVWVCSARIQVAWCICLCGIAKRWKTDFVSAV